MNTLCGWNVLFSDVWLSLGFYTVSQWSLMYKTAYILLGCVCAFKDCQAEEWAGHCAWELQSDVGDADGDGARTRGCLWPRAPPGPKSVLVFFLLFFSTCFLSARVQSFVCITKYSFHVMTVLNAPLEGVEALCISGTRHFDAFPFHIWSVWGFLQLTVRMY